MFKDWIMNPIEHVLNDRLPSYQDAEIEIRYSNLKDYSTALGATSFSISDFINKRV